MSRPDSADLDEDIAAFLAGFALRFDGYRDAESRGRVDPLATWTQRFVATLAMSQEPNENHAAFFALQRYLPKWGGEMLSDQSREHLAYRLLFLYLYRVEVPPGFALASDTSGDDLDLSRIEAIAAHVREQRIALTLRHGDPILPGAGSKQAR